MLQGFPEKRGWCVAVRVSYLLGHLGQAGTPTLVSGGKLAALVLGICPEAGPATHALKEGPMYGRKIGIECPILHAKLDQPFPIGFSDAMDSAHASAVNAALAAKCSLRLVPFAWEMAIAMAGLVQLHALCPGVLFLSVECMVINACIIIADSAWPGFQLSQWCDSICTIVQALAPGWPLSILINSCTVSSHRVEHLAADVPMQDLLTACFPAAIVC
jgi:hypothetical protein